MEPSIIIGDTHPIKSDDERVQYSARCDDLRQIIRRIGNIIMASDVRNRSDENALLVAIELATAQFHQRRND